MELFVLDFNLIGKRFLDIMGSTFGLIILSPIMFVTIILIKITMPGPILFSQRRVGKNKEQFSILKFRTMIVDREAEEKFDFTSDKKRITPFGKFLRRTKIDELPQLINVLLGQMSLVGPRPTVMIQVEKYTEIQLKRLSVKPGMTGLAQTNGNTSLSWEQRMIYDIHYVEKFSLGLDFRILMKTIAIVIFGEEKFIRKNI